ncbi:MAG TPA: putative lipid II flippase FtsW [Verrucomicrobiae bacterium]
MKVAVTTLAFCVTSLLALGLVMLYSSSMVMVDKHTNSEIGAHMLQMQMVWCALGVVACVVLAALDYEILKRFALPFFIATLFLAALVFVPHIGHASHGAHRWISKFGFTFQPSEFVKIALIIMLAWYGDYSQRKMNTFKRGIIIPGIIIASALGLIFIEPDRGTTILLAAVSGTMLMIAGVRWLHVIPPVLAAGAALVYSLTHDAMRSGRITAWLHPEAHASGAALQAEQAKIAIGSGGLTGLGLGDGMQKHGFLPEIQSDFIFANIGEELGLVATLLVILAFLIITICGLFIALRSRDRFGCLLAVGVTSLISYQAIINIGVVTSLLPNKGLALPFISAGGSSLLAMLIGVGILLSVARQAVPVKISASDFVANDQPNPFAAKAT